MRNATPRNLILLIGIGVLLLTARSEATLAKRAPASVHAKSLKSAHVHYGRNWKRSHRAYAASRRFVKPRGYARAYYRRVYPRPWDSYETDLLFDCLMSQPFVICP